MRFEDSRFPFFPHCTLRMAGPLSAGDVSELFGLQFPGKFSLGWLALYQRLPDDSIRKVWAARLSG